jgi:hypothetical protein
MKDESIGEIFAHGIMDVEIIDGVFHCVLFCNRDITTRHPWKEVVMRVALPAANVPECVELVVGALAGHAKDVIVRKAMALMH